MSDELKVAEIVVSVLAGVGGVVLLFMPGYILGGVYSRGIRGRELSDPALAAATAIGGVTVQLAWLFWTVPLIEEVAEDGANDHLLQIVIWGLVVLIVTPALIGAGLAWLSDRHSPAWLVRTLSVLGLSASVRTTEAWNWVFRQRFPAFVRVRLKDGRLVLGYYGPSSAASQDAASPDIYLEKLYASEKGRFGAAMPRTKGVWIAGEQIASIEFFAVKGERHE
jgi:Family of unknown function (DUF6338)